MNMSVRSLGQLCVLVATGLAGITWAADTSQPQKDAEQYIRTGPASTPGRAQRGPGDAAQDTRVVEQLLQLESGWVKASEMRDKAWLERFFADEFVSTHPTSGTIKDKSREIADTVDPSTAVESMHLGDMHVRVIGDVAIVTGSSSELGGGGHLTDRSRAYLFTDTFLRRDGRWQILASHSSRIGCPASK